MEKILKDIQENFEYSNQLAEHINSLADFQIKIFERIEIIEEKLNIGIN